MNPLSNRLVWMYQKNKHVIDALFLGKAPDFVVQSKPKQELQHIPVFTFHVAIPERFELQCRHLAENGYHTMSAEEFRKVMFGEVAPKKNSVLVTFDDGLKQVWTVAYPILRKYGLRGTVFLVPGCMGGIEAPLRPTLDDVWEGRAEEADVFGVRPNEDALATWSEVREMHGSGVIDFHSHTMWHSLVYSSDKIVDFGRPDYGLHYFGNVHLPLYRDSGRDVTERNLRLGMPIYEATPRMQTGARFFEDQTVSDRCVEFVAQEGGAEFFKRRDWRSRLDERARELRQAEGVTERFESPSERDAAIVSELDAARSNIEAHLPGHKVDQLCFPWYRGADFAQEAAAKTGHTITYFDREPGIMENVAGSGKGQIARIDETWLRRLPGAGRMSKPDVVREMFELRGLMSRMFLDAA